MDTADPLTAANAEAEKVRARSVELIHQTQARVEEMRADIEQEAEQVLDAAREQAAAIMAEADARKAAIIAETEERVALIEEEAIKAGVEAVEADRAKYKDSITEIVNKSLTDARSLISNGEEQAKEMVEQAEEQAQAMLAEAEEAMAEAEAMRAKAEDALQVADSDAEEKRQHAAGMLEAIERLKAQLQARAAEQGITTAEATNGATPSTEPEPVAVQHDLPVVRPSGPEAANVTV